VTYDSIRRLADLVASISLLVVLSPVLALVSIAILVFDGPPVFFVQPRAGRVGRPFRLLKFRTMRASSAPAEMRGQVWEGDPEVTWLGAVLRRTKLDEVPQLINVLRGEMSIIGPRPALVSDTERYTAFERRRLEVRPGLTGLAQVSGNIYLSWPDRIKLDVSYIDRRSARLDAWILCRTISVIVRGEESGLSTGGGPK